MEELLQKRLVADFCGVEYHPDGLGVAGGMRANRLIAGILDVAADITGFGFDYAGDLVEVVLDSPKAPGRKYRFLQNLIIT
jgi:hypothetical protein